MDNLNIKELLDKIKLFLEERGEYVEVGTVTNFATGKTDVEMYCSQTGEEITTIPIENLKSWDIMSDSDKGLTLGVTKRRRMSFKEYQNKVKAKGNSLSVIHSVEEAKEYLLLAATFANAQGMHLESLAEESLKLLNEHLDTELNWGT